MSNSFRVLDQGNESSLVPVVEFGGVGCFVHCQQLITQCSFLDQNVTADVRARDRNISCQGCTILKQFVSSLLSRFKHASFISSQRSLPPFVRDSCDLTLNRQHSLFKLRKFCRGEWRHSCSQIPGQLVCRFSYCFTRDYSPKMYKEDQRFSL